MDDTTTVSDVLRRQRDDVPFSSQEESSFDSKMNVMEDDDQEEEEEDKDDEKQQPQHQPFCSVLNTVVDYVMVPPHPYLEREDYYEENNERATSNIAAGSTSTSTALFNNNNNNTLLVPVVRVFGPILRRDHHHSRHNIIQEPAQSACLHIHGVFPYLLARPVVAGPDGSMHYRHDGSSSNKRHSHVDWDDRQAVERILPMLHKHLERAVQELYSGIDSKNRVSVSSNNNNNTQGRRKDPPGDNSNKNKKKRKIIRKLTVVMGRGFYTYCPGPPAPFLRVEYYNPSDRWKVKKCLERGLIDIPAIYHPHPLQYNYYPFGGGKNRRRKRTQKCNQHPSKPLEDDSSSDDDNDNMHQQQDKQDKDKNDDDDDALRFHCYEAHIPYTMQFFKDWNLAGMSYIHVAAQQAAVLFRRRLPTKLRRRQYYYSPHRALLSQQQQQQDDDHSFLFLASNTPEQNIWPLYDESNENDKEDKSNDDDLSNNEKGAAAAFLEDIIQPSMDNSSISSNKRRRRESLEPIPQQEVLSSSSQDSSTGGGGEAAAANDDDDDNDVMHDNPQEAADRSNWLLDDENDDNDDESEHDDEKMPAHRGKLDNTDGDDDDDERYRLLRLVPPPVKETTCDVELDIPIDAILNVLDVMTDLPAAANQEEEQEHIHWRAVPSLREIWQQERRRMGKLLKPKHDFLSHPSAPPAASPQPAFTLDVKKGAAAPGAKLALQGMRRLFPPGLEDNFRRVLKEIVDRYADDVDRVDTLLLNADKHRVEKGGESGDAGLHAMKNGHGSVATAKLANGLSSQEQDQQLTPSENETMEALCALGDAFGATATSAAGAGEHETRELPNSQSSFEENGVAFSQSSTATANNNSANDRFQALSQTYYSAPSNAAQQQTEMIDDYEFTQRVDRGEPVVDGPFRYAEDFLDPQTLLPFEDIDDEDDGEDDEEAEETALEALATQTLLGDKDEVPVGRSSLMDDEDGEDDEGAESLLAAQTSDSRREAIDMMLEGDSSVASEAGMASDDEIMSKDDNDRGRPSLGEALQEAEAALGERASQNAYTMLCPETPLTGEANGKESNVMLTDPPTRAELKSPDSQLHPLPNSGAVPSWMKHSFAYDKIRKAWAGGTQAPECWLPDVGEKGITVQLTRPAPGRGEVVSWMSRHSRKRRPSPVDELNSASRTAKRAKTSSGGDMAKPSSTAILEIDSNSRKLITTTSGNSTGGVDHSATAFEEIEEVEWQASQAASQMEVGQKASQETEGGRTSESQNTQLSDSVSMSKSTATESAPFSEEIASPGRALQGIGNQGGRIQVEGGGELKAKVRPSQPAEQDQLLSGKKSSTAAQNEYLPTPVSIMTIEVHVQCRKGRAGVSDSTKIAMTPDSKRDKIYAAVYVYAKDPGGGDPMQVVERGCIFVPVERELASFGTGEDRKAGLTRLAAQMRQSVPRTTMGKTSPLCVDCVEDEKRLLHRLASLVYTRDPDMLLSWDTQGAGLGYLIERGAAVGNVHGESEKRKEIDMVRLLGRTRWSMSEATEMQSAFQQTDADEKSSGEAGKDGQRKWKGSGMGSEWDDRVGAGAAAASIPGRLVFAAWKIIAEEVKHANASYQQAIIWSVLHQRIPFHDNLKLTQWYAESSGRERWRVIQHRLVQATASLLLFDALDIIGRSQEAARLSGVEFSQSFPGIRGSQYKVEGVLLRALQSLNSNERGSKKGIANKRALTRSTPESSLSHDSKSQTQSPWKARRLPATRKDDQQDSEAVNEEDWSDRSYFFYSPSLEDTSRQEALEVQAMTLEPKSGHYKDPVVVCDFTALYPSLVIAYNLCYSTCAGNLDYQSTRAEMGREGKTTGKLGPFFYPEGRTATVLRHHVKSLSNPKEMDRDRAYIAPSRTLYVSETVCKGVLPQVLDEMLSTRAMLKKAAKQYKKNVPDLSPAVLRQLEARQLALKYVANVTYGYTSATFSGRCAMPLLADTIVECGRRTLSNAIDLANSWGKDRNNKWYGCEVIYGDTDSCFVKLPGRSVKEAFQFGSEFCRAVTASNPPPVQLKLEKVYSGSIMQTKKKYCGMKFESPDQRKPTFEAKGLETIRRDQCALTQKVLRNCLISLFNSGIDAVKGYLFRQWQCILSRKVPVSDFILTGRVRSRYRGGGMGPVQAALSRRLAEADPGRVVRHGERLAYVIVATPGGRNAKLRDGVKTPMELLEQWDAFVVNSAYYITKHVNPALQRCLGLPPNHVNVTSWYESCPKPLKRSHFWPVTSRGSAATVSSFFGSSICALCGAKGKTQGDGSRIAICENCKRDNVQSLLTAMERLNVTQRQAHAVAAQKCAECTLCYEDASTFGVVRRRPATSKRKKKTATTTTTNGSSSSSFWGAGESAGVVTPLANCSCIDCPVTFERHRLRETELEATAVCRALLSGPAGGQDEELF